MAKKSTADVISLQERSRRAAASRAQRGSDLPRRHPSLVSEPDTRTAAAEHAPAERQGGRRALAGVPAEDARQGNLATRVAGFAGSMWQRLTGDYTVDEFGFDPHFNDTVVMPLLRTMYAGWFRVEVSGIENVPDTGGALIVANHAGVLPLDGLMASVAIRDKHPARRTLRMLAPDLVFESPVFGSLARKAGCTYPCAADAQRLLARGELTAVFPEGYRGLGKRFKNRYKLQSFDDKGFISAALRTQTPIVPCAIVGSEEIYPMIGDLRPLARLLDVPYFPVTPLWPLAGPIGLIPLPSKWHIEFGEPISTATVDDRQHDDPMLVAQFTDQLRETIQQTLHRLLANRRNAFMD